MIKQCLILFISNIIFWIQRIGTRAYTNTELHSLDEATDENAESVVEREFNEEKEMNNPFLVKGLKFKNFKEFKDAVRNWGIKNRYQPYFSHNDKTRCIAKCCKEKKTCKFYIYAGRVSADDPTVQIKTVCLRHTCGKVWNNFHMTAKWLAKRYVNRFRANPLWNEAGLIDLIQNDLRFTITHSKAWRTKNICMNLIYGDEAKQYQHLRAYANDLTLTNPGSTTELWTERSHFMGFYVCLWPLKEAFKKFLRPIICLDGCWLKGTYGGQLLSAIAIDPNDCMFPVAWAVVLTESRQTWSWFLQLLMIDLEINNSFGITFMSDRQKVCISINF